MVFFQISILPDQTYSFQWPFNTSGNLSQLLLKSFWEPPYFVETELNGANLLNTGIQAERRNLTCNLPDLAKFEAESLVVLEVETAKEASLSNIQSGSVAEELHTAREHSQIVEHPDAVVRTVVNELVNEVADV